MRSLNPRDNISEIFIRSKSPPELTTPFPLITTTLDLFILVSKYNSLQELSTSGLGERR
jgi:hypothetical protein